MSSMLSTTNTSNISTNIASDEAMNFRESQTGYIAVEAPTVENTDEILAENLAASDDVLNGVNTEIENTNENTDAKKTQTADTLVTTGVSAIGVGAGIGAAIGSIIPGIGTVIGGAVGALIGAVICLGCVIASAVVRPAKEPENLIAASGQAAGALETGAESASTLSNQSTSTADAMLIESAAPTTTTTTTASAPVV